MTAIRATVIEGVYQAATWLGLKSKETCMRFAEQGFLLFYSGTSFSIGMVYNAQFAIHDTDANIAF